MANFLSVDIVEISIPDELIPVIGVRGEPGTPGATGPAGAVGPAGADGANGINEWDVPPVNPHANDDEFTSDTIAGGDWTLVNFSTPGDSGGLPTATIQNGYLEIYATPKEGRFHRLAVKTAPTGDFYAFARVYFVGPIREVTEVGMVVRESSSGHFSFFGWSGWFSAAQFKHCRFDAPDNRSFEGQEYQSLGAATYIRAKVNRTAGNVTWSVSWDGRRYLDVETHSFASGDAGAFGAGGPDQVGFTASPFRGTIPAAIHIDYIRFTSF